MKKGPLMKQKELFQKIRNTLEGFGLNITAPPEEEAKLPFQALIASFGTDEEERPLALQVLQYSKQIEAALMPEGEIKETPIDINIISFIMTVPVEVKSECLQEVLSLVALMNKALPLGSFNYSDTEKVVYYSYNFPICVDPPSEMILLTIIQTILFAKDTFITVIEDISTGKETIASFLETLNEPLPAK